MKKISFVWLLLAVACGDPATTEQTAADTTATPMAEGSAAQEVRLTKFTDSPEYMDAMLNISSPASEAVSSPVEMQFEVKNYELGVQTEGAAEKGIANSGKGQHIHLIVDNGPYSALYEPNASKELDEGHHVVLAFLSRSYHESVKNPEAFDARVVTIGSPDGAAPDLTKPHLFYSRPKGEYSGKDTEKVLLDWYLVNTDLSEGGNQVRITINGKEIMTTSEWTPYLIEGMPMGENTIKLELLDSGGNLIDSPFNPSERTVTLSEGSAS